MLSALLALAVVIAFMPMLVGKITEKNLARENAAIISQVSAVMNAARAYLDAGQKIFPNGISVLKSDNLIDALEPFGLPLGFIPTTPLGQEISLIISKDSGNSLMLVALTGGKLTPLRQAEISSGIGYWAAAAGSETNEISGWNGGWKIENPPNDLPLNPDAIYVRVPDSDEFSEMVGRNMKNPEKTPFHTTLKMDGNNIAGVQGLSAYSAEIANITANDLMLSGTDADKKNKNAIGGIRANRVVFSSKDGSPLVVSRGDLSVENLTANSVGNFLDPPALSTAAIAIRDFNMTAGRTGFTGPAVWDIKTSATMTNITLSVEKINISSFIDATRGQDAYVEDDGTIAEYTSGSGIKVDVIKTDNIILRDQISSSLLAGGTGAAILEIRPAGTSVLPDVLVAQINNDALQIPVSAADNNGKLESCKTIITRFGGKYNAQSLAQNITCQFVMYNRIERRIDMKKCMDDGGENC